MSNSHVSFIRDCGLIAAGAQRAAQDADVSTRRYWLKVADGWKGLAVGALSGAIIVSHRKIAA